MSLNERVAIITGANSDLGIKTALEFANAKIRGLVLCYHKDNETIKSIITKLEECNVEVMVEQVDVSNIESVCSLYNSILNRFEKIDILVAYAGYPAEKDLWFRDPLELDDDMLDKPWNVDLKGSYNCIRVFANNMKRHGYGKIILTSSTPAIYGEHIGLPFTLAKAAIISLTKSLAKVLAPEICINALALGSIETRSNLKNYTPHDIEMLTSNIPLRRFGKAEEVARVARFLASDDSNYITGQTIVIDGGEVRH
ncbi:MAG: SDR family oxidoreductase [Candidatus Nitrosocaldaceae archaeon]